MMLVTYYATVANQIRKKNNVICKFGTFQEEKNIKIKPHDNDLININQCASIPEYKGLADPVIFPAVLLSALRV